jgi:hypothetical protein
MFSFFYGYSFTNKKKFINCFLIISLKLFLLDLLLAKFNNWSLTFGAFFRLSDEKSYEKQSPNTKDRKSIA